MRTVVKITTNIVLICIGHIKGNFALVIVTGNLTNRLKSNMIVDLCSGIGRFESPNEEVISIDINPSTKPTICADIRYLPLKPGLKPRLVHASPTCTYFSKARRWGYGWNPKGIADSLKLVAACYDAAAYLEAENFSLENPAGLEDILGHKVKFKYDKYDIKNATTNVYLSKKAQRRAIIPKDVRQEILELTNDTK